MKTIKLILITMFTTIATFFTLILLITSNVITVPGFYTSAPVPATTLVNSDLPPSYIVPVINQEEAQMAAIDAVAQAIVGIMTSIDSPGNMLGSFGSNRGGTGSGIVYQVKDGNTYIVTNEHVVDGANRIEVVFNDEHQTRFDATIVGSDVYTDLAVLRIENFEANVIATFGQTENLRLGQSVIAIGNPLGLDFAGSATMGIVSGHNRSVSIPIVSTTGQTQNWSMTVLQTDTAINPGNSGGALINLNGEVVGINSMKVNHATVEGMSFSIPTYIALPIIEDLETYGHVTRPILGVNLAAIAMMPNQLREQINLPNDVTNGVFIHDVVPQSLAAAIGIQIDDVITHIGNQPVRDHTSFRQALFNYRHGDEIAFTVIRNGETLNLDGMIDLNQRGIN